jgi:5-methylcytosine-specific restriction endonuclease McrA
MVSGWKKVVIKTNKINREKWRIKFTGKLKPFHKTHTNSIVTKLLSKIDRQKYSMDSRAKKNNKVNTVTIEDLRSLIYNSYGTKCKFCNKLLIYQTYTFDHIIPVSKGGEFKKENIQVICKTSNKIKGSLNEVDFFELLNWLSTQPEQFVKNILQRLAGVHL